MRSKILIYGAGAIGRGFLAPTLNNLGCDISFVDADELLINRLKTRKSYKTAFAPNGKYKFENVEVRSAHLLGEEKPEEADIVFTAVGARNYKSLAERLRKAKCIVSCENEKLSAFALERRTERPCFFAIPDTITSNTAPRSLLDADPLCVVSELGDLVLEKGDYDLPSEIRQVSKSELEAHWACKFYLHNCPHAIAAYLGWVHKVDYIHEAMEVSQIDDIVAKAMNSVKTAIVRLGMADDKFAEDYTARELSRFRNPLLFDPITRVVRNPLIKLAADERLIGTAKIVQRAKVDPYYICLGIRAALAYSNPNDTEFQRLKKEIGDKGILTKISGLSPKSYLYNLIMGLRTLAPDNFLKKWVMIHDF